MDNIIQQITDWLKGVLVSGIMNNLTDTNDDGTITFSLNRGNIPQLTVSPSFTDMIDTYRKQPERMKIQRFVFYHRNKRRPVQSVRYRQFRSI